MARLTMDTGLDAKPDGSTALRDRQQGTIVDQDQTTYQENWHNGLEPTDQAPLWAAANVR